MQGTVLKTRTKVPFYEEKTNAITAVEWVTTPRNALQEVIMV